MTKAEIKALIDALITTNGDGEITGAGLNQVLTEINNSGATITAAAIIAALGYTPADAEVVGEIDAILTATLG